MRTIIILCAPGMLALAVLDLTSIAKDIHTIASPPIAVDTN